MKVDDSAIVAARDSFFASRNWQRKQCPFCLEEYYAKRDLPHCGSYRCAGSYQFLNIPAPKAYLELGACASTLRSFFTGRGHSPHQPIAIVRDDERTLFASTAGQIYDDLIYGQARQEETRRCVVLQPVIRLQGIGSVASLDGISTSFVHAATECWNVTAEEHFNVFDQWLDFFSSLGLHVGGLCLKIKRADNDWSGRMVTSEMLKINYSGLEVGVANFFFNIPQTSETVATLSDIGVGIERLVWAINKSPAYFDGIGPLSSVIMQKKSRPRCRSDGNAYGGFRCCARSQEPRIKAPRDDRVDCGGSASLESLRACALLPSAMDFVYGSADNERTNVLGDLAGDQSGPQPGNQSRAGD